MSFEMATADPGQSLFLRLIRHPRIVVPRWASVECRRECLPSILAANPPVSSGSAGRLALRDTVPLSCANQDPVQSSHREGRDPLIGTGQWSLCSQYDHGIHTLICPADVVPSLVDERHRQLFRACWAHYSYGSKKQSSCYRQAFHPASWWTCHGRSQL